MKSGRASERVPGVATVGLEPFSQFFGYATNVGFCVGNTI
ncbi:hypothetical protein DT23_13010 [Thioclava indica]|uniref:Uncharacterized protein n=1 Tax=Thioclava indica TaxID=1353528 RepID=A0A074JW11_9RHOB|nr:hypothetical protein DT23_13010 [Thioclava indica]